MTVPVLNKSDEQIPAYGAMVLRLTEDDVPSATEEDNGRVVWHAYKP